MSEDARGRAQRLIELATHPSANETEARNAAVAACRLIKEHRLLGTQAPTPPPPPRTRVVYATGAVVDDMQSAMDELFGQVNRQRQARQQARDQQRARPPEHKVEGDNYPRQKMAPDPRASVFRIASPAICIYCQEVVTPPAPVVVSMRRVFHPACYNEAIGR
jgi:hypothetical protein